uniref:GmrSD restriction endonuclease domain-containing protein n=1 Tax=Flavobacterium sp. TaxID=239 RepID=UPI00404B0307
MENKEQLFEKIFKQHLKIETYSQSIDSLYSPRLKNRIDYKPYYQRNYVWDNNKATYFIESILIGTEVPPLIFFDNNENIEIIDGRQRFETILRFMDNQFSLSTKGLKILRQLGKKTFSELSKTDSEILDNFLDAKIRIINFQLVNEPPLDDFLADRVKKEIFSRYNTGITPLKKSEVDNAKYDEDELSNEFKSILHKDLNLRKLIYNTFFKPTKNKEDNPPVEDIMSFIRRYLILPMYPIKSYASGGGRTELLTLLYESFSNKIEDCKVVTKNFIEKLKFISRIKEYSETNNLHVNRLALETILWGLGVLEQEDIKIELDDNFVVNASNYINDNINNYSTEDYQFNKIVLTRFNSTINLFSQFTKKNLDTYLVADNDKKEELKELRKPKDTTTALSELESLRLNKPEPSRNSIDDIVRTMQRRRFLIRPSYQRQEVINPTKASSIIESILLDIKLPPIFVFKRADGINEVIDGQQRLLTILGFIGEKYLSENNELSVSKNHSFYLRKLRILKELEGSKFSDLTDEQKGKILDFQLYVIEIDENQNPNFDPIDLFIRLNDKPYPIRVNSFEMWNSWVDNAIIEEIKKLTTELKPWFYLKQLSRKSDRDRMESEELLTSLIYLEYSLNYSNSYKGLDIFQKTDRINARIGDKSSITNLFQEVSENENDKKNYLKSIKNIKSFIKKVKLILIDRDVENELEDFLKAELDILFKANKENKFFRRTMQDFYILWFILSDINFEMVKYHRINLKKEIIDIFSYMKDIPLENQEKNNGYEVFSNTILALKEKYKKQERKLKLTEEEKAIFIKEQNNISPYSGAPVFVGDEIEVDHIESLAKGGEDEIGNIQILHTNENREKSSK